MIALFYKIFYTLRMIKYLLNGSYSHRIVMENNSKDVLHIVTNGPSLKDSVSVITEVGGDVMMMNEMYKHELYYELKPKYMCFFDSNTYLDNPDLDEFLRNITESADDIKIFFSYSLYEKWYKKYKNINYFWISSAGMTKSYTKYKMKWLYKKNFASPVTYTVALAAIYAGIQLGYKKVYLHGNDFSFINTYFVDENNEVWFKNKHAYENKEIKYKVNGDMKSEMYNLYYCYVGYDNVNEYANDNNVEIINMSPYSFIDVFKKNQYGGER